MTNENDSITRREFVAGGVSLAATSVLVNNAAGSSSSSKNWSNFEESSCGNK